MDVETARRALLVLATQFFYYFGKYIEACAEMELGHRNPRPLWFVSYDELFAGVEL